MKDAYQRQFFLSGQVDGVTTACTLLRDHRSAPIQGAPAVSFCMKVAGAWCFILYDGD